MSEKDNGGPAFPMIYQDDTRCDASGLTLRDHFAGLAMQAYLSRSDADQTHWEDHAEAAYAAADAMLKMRT